MNLAVIAQGLTAHLVDETETDRLAAALASLASPGTVIGLVGTLGAGKTRLSRGIAQALGVDPRSIASPTFVLIHEYEGRLPVFHFDAYRLTSSVEFAALGPEEYWHAGGVCLVEWADRVADLLPLDAWWIHIEVNGPTERTLQIQFPHAAQVVALFQQGDSEGAAF